MDIDTRLKRPFVCELHFTRASFVGDPVYKKAVGLRRTLKADAVPSVFCNLQVSKKKNIVILVVMYSLHIFVA